MRQLNLDEYARRLCAAKEAYDYSAVTCFDFDAFLQLKGRNILKKKELYEKDHQNNMLEVEELIRGQLLSQDTEVVKDGLSNVLFWGYATQGIQQTRVRRFREGVTDSQVDQFKGVAGSLCHIGLYDIQRIKMPEYSRVAFMSKLLMFLYPDKYPVLDNQIADFGKKFNIIGLNELKTTTDTSIRLTDKTRERYVQWALWCRQIAETINSNLSSPCKGLRAVDVERAIYRRIPNKRNKNQDTTEARLLLAGPDTD